MSHAKWDRKKGRDLFVQEGKSYREVARILGVSHAVVALAGKNDDWPGQKLAYESSLARRSYEMAAERLAEGNAAILQENVTISRAALRRYATQLQDPTFKVSSKDALDFMRFLADQLGRNEGEPAPRDAIIEGTAIPVGDADSLRRLVQLARERATPPGVLGGAPVGEPPGTRPN